MINSVNNSNDSLQNAIKAISIFRKACCDAADDLGRYLHCLCVTSDALETDELKNSWNDIFGVRAEYVIDVLRKEDNMLNEALCLAIKATKSESNED